MSSDWRLIGFDARDGGSFPLRVSVDSQIWPSVFEKCGIQRPDWIGPVQDLWDNKEKLERAVTKSRAKIEGDFKIVAVGVLPESCDPAGHARWATRLDELNPSHIDGSWPLLGYDVADEYLESTISMLLATGEAQEDSLRLNYWSLFDDLQTAQSFRDLATALHPEQSPYCVYGIWEAR